MKEKAKLIGVMDSGFGGLSVLQELMFELPSLDVIYYGDLLNSPYGTKDSQVVRNFVDEIVRFFVGNKVDAVLLACNTATSVGISYLREKYSIPIFGMEPAIKPALQGSHTHNVAVLATSLTLREDKFEKLGKSLGAEERIVPYNCDGLATLIDKEDFSGIEQFLKPIIKDIEEKNIDSIVLGCTHYVLVKPIIHSLLSTKVKLFDGNTGTIKHIQKTLNLHEQEDRESKLELYLNGGTDFEFEIAYRYLNSVNREENKYVK